MNLLYNTPDMLSINQLVTHLRDDNQWYWLQVRNQHTVTGKLGCFIYNPGIKMLATIDIERNSATSLNIAIEQSDMDMSNDEIRDAITTQLKASELNVIVENCLFTFFNSLSIDIQGLMDYVNLPDAWRIVEDTNEQNVTAYCLPCMSEGVFIRQLYMKVYESGKQHVHCEIYGKGLSYFMHDEHISLGDISKKIVEHINVPLHTLAKQTDINELQRDILTSPVHTKRHYSGSHLYT